MSGRQSGVGADRRRHEKDEYDGFGLSDLRAAESSHYEQAISCFGPHLHPFDGRISEWTRRCMHIPRNVSAGRQRFRRCVRRC